MMDGKDYKAAAARQKGGVDIEAVRRYFAAYKEAGITFVRDGGDALGVCAAAKVVAPEYGIDYITPIFAIHKKGHYGGIVGHAFTDMDGYHALVLRAKAEGADFIKIMISGIMDFSEFGKMSEDGLEPSEIREMIKIAHAEGMTVMAHANGDRIVRAALEAGVDTFEHGYYLTEETIDMLAETASIWVPTLAPVGNLLGCGRFPDEAVGRILSLQMKNVRRALEKGARLGLGSDAGAYLVPHGQGILDEYEYMKQAVGDGLRCSLDDSLKRSEEWIRENMRRRF